jgi:hypothetical protein
VDGDEQNNYRLENSECEKRDTLVHLVRKKEFDESQCGKSCQDFLFFGVIDMVCPAPFRRVIRARLHEKHFDTFSKNKFLHEIQIERMRTNGNSQFSPAIAPTRMWVAVFLVHRQQGRYKRGQGRKRVLPLKSGGIC